MAIAERDNNPTAMTVSRIISEIVITKAKPLGCGTGSEVFMSWLEDGAIPGDPPRIYG